MNFTPLPDQSWDVGHPKMGLSCLGRLSTAWQPRVICQQHPQQRGQPGPHWKITVHYSSVVLLCLFFFLLYFASRQLLTCHKLAHFFHLLTEGSQGVRCFPALLRPIFHVMKSGLWQVSDSDRDSHTVLSFSLGSAIPSLLTSYLATISR